LIWVD